MSEEQVNPTSRYPWMEGFDEAFDRAYKAYGGGDLNYWDGIEVLEGMGIKRSRSALYDNITSDSYARIATCTGLNIGEAELYIAGAGAAVVSLLKDGEFPNV
jgi:hypothetical protein